MTDNAKDQAVICECEMVTQGEINYAINQLDVHNLVDLRRRTRLGMGPCQGELCTYRAAGLFEECGQVSGNQSSQLLTHFLEERWKGIKPVFWGDALREAEFSYWIYEGLFGASDIPTSNMPTPNTQLEKDHVDGSQITTSQSKEKQEATL